jgi:hypothetical protein
MKKRPRSITVIGWLLIVVPIFILVASASIWIYFKRRDSIDTLLIPNGAQIAVMAVSVFVNVICGIYILKGRGWARTLYAVQGVINLGNALFFHPLKSNIPALVLFLAIVFFLFGADANEYFLS